jgi:hypothetical protein
VVIGNFKHEHNYRHRHQSLGMRAPAERFALAAGPDLQVVDPITAVAAGGQPQAATQRGDLRRAVQRRVDQRGSIRLAGFGYRVPIVLAGEAVEAVVADNLVQIYHHDVLVASHVQRRKAEAPPAVLRQGRRKRDRGPSPNGASRSGSCRTTPRADAGAMTRMQTGTAGKRELYTYDDLQPLVRPGPSTPSRSSTDEPAQTGPVIRQQQGFVGILTLNRPAWTGVATCRVLLETDLVSTRRDDTSG